MPFPMNYAEVQAPVAPRLREAERILSAALETHHPLMQNLLHHTPARGGKKVRSTLLFLLAECRGIATPTLDALGAAIEMFHLSSLIHDDICDNSHQRRGEKTLHSHAGNLLSVLWGDYCFITSLKLFNDQGHPNLVEPLIRSAQEMIAGQILEFDHTNDYELDERTYCTIIGQKTAALFSGIAEIAALLADEPAETTAEYAAFGTDFGMVFQIRDDLLDIYSTESGKDRFRDLQEGKITLPTIRLVREYSAEQIRKLVETKDSAAIIDLIERSGVLTEVSRVMDEYAGKARAFLGRFADSPARRSLYGLLDFVSQRDF